MKSRLFSLWSIGGKVNIHNFRDLLCYKSAIHACVPLVLAFIQLSNFQLNMEQICIHLFHFLSVSTPRFRRITFPLAKANIIDHKSWSYNLSSFSFLSRNKKKILWFWLYVCYLNNFSCCWKLSSINITDLLCFILTCKASSGWGRRGKGGSGAQRPAEAPVLTAAGWLFGLWDAQVIPCVK